MAIENCSPTGVDIKNTGFGYTLSIIGGIYKMIIMYWLSEDKPVMRFNELKRCIGTIAYKTLSNTLKEMEADKLIIRQSTHRFRQRWNTVLRNLENL